MYIIYKTDAWHSYASRDLIGVATDEEFILPIIEAQTQKEGEKLNKSARNDLINMNQTQSYKGEGEFHVEEIQPNTLL